VLSCSIVCALFKNIEPRPDINTIKVENMGSARANSNIDNIDNTDNIILFNAADALLTCQILINILNPIDKSRTIEKLISMHNIKT
jgi:hypothetical protein